VLKKIQEIDDLVNGSTVNRRLLNLKFSKMARVKNRFWSPRKRAKAVALRELGLTYDDIAKKLGNGATKSGVRKLCVKFTETKSFADKFRSGRPKETTPKADRRLVRMSLGDRHLNSRQLQHLWGANVSTKTVSRRLRSAGLFARRPWKKPLLTVAMRQKRLAWARKHKNWTVEQWQNVIFSDETKVNMYRSDGNFFIRRRSGEALLPCCTQKTVKFGTSVMIWGCMNANTVGRLHIITGTVNANVYVNEILVKKLLPSAEMMYGKRGEYIFQQDNAPCHTAGSVKKWFRENKVNVLDCRAIARILIRSRICGDN
jgi:transposase